MRSRVQQSDQTQLAVCRIKEIERQKQTLQNYAFYAFKKTKNKTREMQKRK